MCVESSCVTLPRVGDKGDQLNTQSTRLMSTCGDQVLRSYRTVNQIKDKSG